MLEHEDIVLTNVARGDNASFGVLFNHYYPKVRVYLTNVLEDKHSAQDIAQDIFAKIWLLRKTLPEIRDFGSYLFVMSRNSCLAHMKKRGRSVPPFTIWNWSRSMPSTKCCTLTSSGAGYSG